MIKLAIAAVLICFLEACAIQEKPQVDPVALYKQGIEKGNKAMIEEIQRNLKQKNAYGYVEPYFHSPRQSRGASLQAAKLV